MTKADKAVEAVAAMLSESDQDLYVYAPPGSAHFIPESVIYAVAGFLLGAFFKGAKAAAEKKVEAWGKDVTNWLLDKISSAFVSKSSAEGLREAEAAKTQASAALRAHPNALTLKARTEIQAIIREALAKQMIPIDRADAISRAVVEAGALELQAK